MTRTRTRERSLAVSSDLHLLRYVPGDSLVHRMWPGTKLLVVAAVTIALVLRPTWPGEAAGAAVLLLGVALSRVPRGAVPRPPRWFLYGLAIGAVLAATAGGAPHLGPLGVGGLLDWLRFTFLGAVVLGLAALIGWTTPMADLTPALDRLLTPLRWVRLPVDEIVATVGLCVRCVPLLIDEFRTVLAARRMRAPIVTDGLRGQIVAMHDLLVTALVSALRRARDLADAIEGRGGWHHGPRRAVRLRVGDAVAAMVAVAAVTVIFFV